MSSTEQQEQGRNTHYTFLKLTIDGRQLLHFLSLPLQIICTKENENYEKLLATAPTVVTPHQPEEATRPGSPHQHSLTPSRGIPVMNSCNGPLAILCWTPHTKWLVSPSSHWLPPSCRAARKQQCQHSSRTSIYLKELKSNYSPHIYPEQRKWCVRIQV